MSFMSLPPKAGPSNANTLVYSRTSNCNMWECCPICKKPLPQSPNLISTAKALGDQSVRSIATFTTTSHALCAGSNTAKQQNFAVHKDKDGYTAITSDLPIPTDWYEKEWFSQPRGK